MDRPDDIDNDGLCDALDDVDDRPIYLVLTETELLLPVNATMAPFEVLRFGADVRSWDVTPDLPLGLTIDSEGRISGTPTVVSNLAVYTINASNDLNWATVNLSIAVLDEDADFDNDGLPDAVDPDDDNDGWTDVDEAQCGPTDPFDAEDVPDDSDNDGICDLLDDVSDLQITVTHEPRELHLTVNVTMTPVEANVTGGDVITWTVMGELPAGLALDADNGTISGTPTEACRCRSDHQQQQARRPRSHHRARGHHRRPPTPTTTTPTAGGQERPRTDPPTHGKATSTATASTGPPTRHRRRLAFCRRTRVTGRHAVHR